MKWLVYFGISTLTLPGMAAPHWKALTEDVALRSPASANEFKEPSREIIQEMLKRADMSFEFSHLPQARGLKMAENNEHHFYFAIPKTPEQEAKYKWVGPVFRESIQVVALADKPYEKLNSVADLKKFRVGAMYGSAEAYLLESRGCKPEKVSEDGQNLQKLKTGRIDFYVAPPAYIKFLEKEGLKLKVILEIEEMNLYAAFHRKTPEHFIHRFNSILERMNRDGTTEGILAKYGAGYSGKRPDL